DTHTVWKCLADVINPRTGVSLIEAKLIDRLEVNTDEGGVFAEVLLCELDESYAENIEEEIREHVMAIPGALKVLVQFKPCVHCG
ncbi:iron-sulfur cluster assembly protein, partial [Calditrichota bacterium]